MPNLETERLVLIDFLPEYATAAAKEIQLLERIFPYNVSKQWPNKDFAEILSYIAASLEKNPEKAKWSGLIIHKGDNTLIGELGCKGGPNEEGTVDIGYGVVPDYRGKGYTTEIVTALVSWLFTLPEVKMVTADCLHNNVGSQKVLEKAGFEKYKKDEELIYWRVAR
ncbi:GNAT family N-acetyltransferase [Neobacillus ginsengisoli]|uniref:RimJ/RimL family protein N-acetyltransferase n=1 Tax=Neobacillus ginsengisoli TaxID=904295 RepID=A0ABT9Y2W5_9BACI|nr:GNAT family N-acetyltransferase [Neobacillus ginsengisoli]MDQ0201537.1 RimJ/RimL family protein N-acetyltransferase [Neobacillus ginsengisoli]